MYFQPPPMLVNSGGGLGITRATLGESWNAWRGGRIEHILAFNPAVELALCGAAHRGREARGNMGSFARLARRTAAHFLPHLATSVRCSGCGRGKDDVAHLVAGPGVYVCDECFGQAARRLTPRRPQSHALRCQ